MKLEKPVTVAVFSLLMLGVAASQVGNPAINETPLRVSNQGQVQVNVSGADPDNLTLNLTDANGSLEFRNEKLVNDTGVPELFTFDFKASEDVTSMGEWKVNVSASSGSNSSVFSVVDDLPPEVLNVSKSSDNVSLLEPRFMDRRINFTGVFRDNLSNISKVYLSTNESGFFSNYTRSYSVNVSNGSGKVNKTITWDNSELNLSTGKSIGVRLWGVDNSSYSPDAFSKTLVFRLVEHPVVENLTVEDVEEGSPVKVTAEVYDLSSRRDIGDVDLFVQKPGGGEVVLDMEKGRNISKTRFNGYRYRLYFPDTGEVGSYSVEVTASDESGNRTVYASFDVEDRFIPRFDGLNFNPFYIGQTSVVEGYSLIASVPLAFQVFGGTLAMVLFLTLAVYWGNRYDEADFRPDDGGRR